MADEKKPEAKSADKGTPFKDPFVEIVSFIIILLIVVSILNSIFASINRSRIFSNGWAGLTPTGILTSSTRPIASLFNPVGAGVISLRNTDVYDTPGGKKIGSQNIGAKGKIIQGPVLIGGERYYYVDYESGTDGWVRESDIGYIDPNPSLFTRVAIWLVLSLRFVKAFLILLTIVLICFLVYLIKKLTALRENERKLLYPQTGVTEAVANPQWEKILNHVESPNENDWRQAILEADIMLGNILEKLDLPGDSIGDKLKAVERSDFTTVDNAWEAHKIRNQIAHEGSKFVLTQREARLIISMYQTVFKEFQII